MVILGPYPNESSAALALKSPLVTGLCEEDSMGCYAIDEDRLEAWGDLDQVTDEVERITVDMADENHTGEDPNDKTCRAGGCDEGLASDGVWYCPTHLTSVQEHLSGHHRTALNSVADCPKCTN